ncbi:MAG: sugar transferase [Candidatus Taylorbacteria bacterium]|nr:sugar transferase [Candidatus Taylorbacteria bacterium]
MTRIAMSRRTSLLILGDLLAFVFSLILTLTVRYGSIPDRTLFLTHIVPFSVLFLVFILVGMTVGLYDKQAAFVRRNIRGLVLQTQIVNILFGVIFFYFAPVVIAPKVNLFIYFIISTAALYLWRGFMFPVIVSGRKRIGIIIGTGADVEDLYSEVMGDGKYGMVFKEKLVPDLEPGKMAMIIKEAVARTGASLVIADLRNPAVEGAMSSLYSLIFSGVQVMDVSILYEAIFDRIPLSLVGERWLVENSVLAVGKSKAYDVFKRAMDIVVALVVGLVSLLLYPFICLAIKADDGGPLFVVQERVGKNGKSIKIIKFRSMTADDGGMYGAGQKTTQSITKVGHFIRMTRLDELPQLWSVIKGDQSLIGPRPELPALVKIYEKEVPYYNARHLIKPGLSGWAQIYHRAHPHHAVAINDTRDKLSYDLFYVKNRSLPLDMKIALQTLRALISRQGI